jgi:hypothetical protein
MGKLIILPGVDLYPPSRNELVDEASEMIMKEVMSVFVEQQFEIGCMAIWHQEVRNFFWRTEIKLVDRDFQEQDVKRWRNYWRDQALDYIRSKRVR